MKHNQHCAITPANQFHFRHPKDANISFEPELSTLDATVYLQWLLWYLNDIEWKTYSHNNMRKRHGFDVVYENEVNVKTWRESNLTNMSHFVRKHLKFVGNRKYAVQADFLLVWFWSILQNLKT